MAKVTAEDNLLMAGFQTTIDSDSNGYDSSWDDSDVLRALQANPDLTVGQISPKINIPVHRVVAAIARLKTAGKFPVKPTAGIVVNFPGQDCSKGIGSCINEGNATAGMLVSILGSEGLWKIDSFKDGHAKLDLFQGDRHLPKRRRVALCKLRIAEVETCSKELEPPKLKDFACLTGFVVAYREWENENPDQVDPDQLMPGTKIKLSDGRIAEIIDPINPPGCFVNAIQNGEKLQIADGDYIVLGESVKTVEPVTNILLEEPPRQVEPNGQLSLFFDNSEEPPDPDDFGTLDEYHQQHEIWAKSHPELTQAMAERIDLIEKSKVVLGESTKIVEDTTSTTKEQSENVRDKFCEVNDYIQLKSDPRRIGQITGLKSGGFYKIKFADGFAAEFKSDQFEYRPFSKENSGIVLGESFFKIGEYVTASSPGFEGKVFTVSTIYPTGMIGVIHNGNNLSFPANWLNHHIEKIESKAKSIPLEQTEVTTRKRPAKGCGSGYLMVRSANVKRNEAKGKSPDIYYVYCFSYTNQYGKEIKSSLSVPRAKIAQVKSMVENKEHYVKIAKFLGKNLPLSY